MVHKKYFYIIVTISNIFLSRYSHNILTKIITNFEPVHNTYLLLPMLIYLKKERKKKE